MLRPKGYLTIVAPDAPLLERDTITCAHCQAIVTVKPGTGATVYLVEQGLGLPPKEEAGAGCRRCMAPVCLRCEALGTCTPWEAQLAAIERRITQKVAG